MANVGLTIVRPWNAEMPFPAMPEPPLHNPEVSDSTRRDLRTLPKAHLHVHLEGAMRPTTLLELGEKYGLAPPAPGDGTFSTFLRLYAAACETLRHPDDMEQLVREVAEDAAADGAVWIEPAEWPRPGAAERLGLASPAAVVELVIDAARKAERQTGVGIGVIVQANRLSPTSEAVELARLAASLVGRGVVAFGLAGDEAAGPPEPFIEAFAIARSAGLISAPHAGEHAGPDSVRGALDALGAQRIEHGVRAIEDPRLVERLTSEQVCLDVCPTSNVQLRVVPSLHDHPLARLVEAGVAVSLNADDPLMFGSGLLQEYELARDVLGLDDETLAAIAATSIRASGAPFSVTSAALEGIDRWLRGASPVTSQPNMSGVGLQGGGSPM